MFEDFIFEGLSSEEKTIVPSNKILNEDRNHQVLYHGVRISNGNILVAKNLIWIFIKGFNKSCVRQIE